jgi:lipopolysaccharide-induced tumor necrosis factor-alpha factor
MFFEPPDDEECTLILSSDFPETIIINTNVGPDPTTITCPSCRTTVVTAMDYESTTKTHIIAGLLCLFGCWLCVCIPYCTGKVLVSQKKCQFYSNYLNIQFVGCCRNANHYCPSCGAYIGTYSQ